MKTSSKREKRLIFVFINLCLLTLFNRVITTNYYNINENKLNILLLEQQIENLSFDINNDSQVLIDINNYEIRNNQIRGYLFPIINNQHLHIYIDNLLNQYNLLTLNLDILEVDNIEDVGIIVDLSLRIDGDINDFYDFLLEIENQNKLINIEMLDITRDYEGNHTFLLTLRFFMAQDGVDPNFDFNFGQILDEYTEQYIEQYTE